MPAAAGGAGRAAGAVPPGSSAHAGAAEGTGRFRVRTIPSPPKPVHSQSTDRFPAAQPVSGSPQVTTPPVPATTHGFVVLDEGPARPAAAAQTQDYQAAFLQIDQLHSQWYDQGRRQRLPRARRGPCRRFRRDRAGVPLVHRQRDPTSGIW